MSYPIGYDAEGLKAIITLYDKDGVQQLLWEDSELVVGPPVKEFDLMGFSIHIGINSDHGFATIIIDDKNFQFLDSTQARRSMIIRPGWELEIQMGKNSSNLTKYFVGILQEMAFISR